MNNSTTFQGNGEVAYIPVVVNGKQARQTNADRIRSMTNWEMAKFFVRLFDKTNADCKKLPCNKCCAGKLCSEGILDWLRQEVE